jgi:uncharacterized membrane protein YjgN (DUF898 family)
MEGPGPQSSGKSSFFREPTEPPPVWPTAPSWAPPHGDQPSPTGPAASPDGSGARQVRRLSFRGSGGALFGIHIVNVLLAFVTLGVFTFWGKVRVRRYLLSQSVFEGDRFAYHGTGKELLLGWLKALLLFGIPVALLNLMPQLLGAGRGIQGLVLLLIYLIVMIFLPLAKVGARRYRLSRTSWRGIRFSFRGSALDFVRLYVKGALLTILTLGVYYPFFATEQHAFLVSHSYLGNQRFAFDGRGRDLLGSFLRAVLLTVPTLGLCWFWFIAARHQYYWGHTSVATARFRSTVTGGQRLLLELGNIAMLLLTLGLGWSWVVVRRVQFAFRYVTLEGPLDMATIQQDAQAASTTGEGLAGLLDTEFNFS